MSSNTSNHGLKHLTIAASLALSLAASAGWTLDKSYGSAGLQRLAQDPGSMQSLVASAADAAGRTYAVGTVDRAGARDILVMRFDAQGRLDAGFGFGGSVMIDSGSALDAALAVVVQPDGRVVIGGQRGAGLLLVRLMADGSLDPGFGAGGFVVPTLLTGSGARIVDLALDRLGRIVALGSIAGDGGRAEVNPLVFRVHADGAFDRAFDHDGVRIVREAAATAAAIAITGSGRIVLVGHAGPDYVSAALTESGAPDFGYGERGIDRFTVGAGAVATDLVEHQGSFYVSGLNAATLVRIGAAGGRDPSFAPTGLPAAGVLGAWKIEALADGSLAIGGSCRGVGGDGWMLATLEAGARSFAIDACLPPAPGFAAVRGISATGSTVVAFGVESRSGTVQAASLRFARAVAATPAPARIDPRCKKPAFKKRNPRICGR